MDKLISIMLILTLCLTCIIVTLLYVSLQMQQETRIKVQEISQYLQQLDVYVEEY